MHQTMARMMAAGFRDANGNIRELDENTQQFAQHILDEAERFVKNQKAVENELNKQGESINAVTKIAEDNRRRLAEKDDLDKKQEECIAANRKSIDENHEAIHSNRTQIFAIKAMSTIAMIVSIFSIVLSVVAIVFVFLKK
jgi:Flp pilus assembly protein TadB